MPALHIDLELQPKQEELAELIFATGPNVATKIGFGGSRGGGKSGVARRVMLARRLALANTTGFIIRRNYRDLQENHLEKFREEYPGLSDYYEAGNRQYRFPNGSRLAFKYGDTADDCRQLARGPEAMDVFIDQAEQFSEQELLWLATPCRWPGAERGQCKVAWFFNPGGPGTDYLRRVLFLRQFQGQEEPGDYAFIQSYGWDNYFWFKELGMTPDEFYALSNEERFHLFVSETSYGKALNRLPPAMRIGELMGSFSQFAGQYFAGVWDEEKCILPASVARAVIQPWWTRWMAQDWGFSDHAFHLWFSTGRLAPREALEYLGMTTDWPIDVVIAYRELVAKQTAEKDLANQIVDRTPDDERRMISRFFLSPDACAKKSAHTIAEEMSDVLIRHGLPEAEEADWERVAGWRLLYNGFRQTSALRGSVCDPERAKQGPLLLVSADCANLISSIPMAVRDEKEVEDVMRVSGVLWEDATDALRYGFKSMLGPKKRAPVAVRRQELYNSFGTEIDEAVATERAIAMQRFRVKEAQRSRRKGNFR